VIVAELDSDQKTRKIKVAFAQNLTTLFAFAIQLRTFFRQLVRYTRAQRFRSSAILYGCEVWFVAL
jgi:hypothetical protein